jgi:hypothetical protein
MLPPGRLAPAVASRPVDNQVPTGASSGHDVAVSRTSTTPDVPAATRARPPGWRDPRLWVGVAIVAASVLLGARVVGAADDMVTVWAADADLARGHRLTEADLAPARVRFDAGATTGRYLPADEPLPDDLHLTRGLGAGELVPRAALGTPADSGVVRVSVALPAEQVPTGLAPGARVDVWVVDERSTGAGRAEPVVEDVVVVAAPTAADSLGSVNGGRQLVLGLPADDSGAVATVLAASGDDRVRLVGRG